MSVVIGLMFSIAIQMVFAGIRRIRIPGFESQLALYMDAQSAGPPTRYGRWVRPWALRLADSVSLLRSFSDPDLIGKQLKYAGTPHGITAHEFYGVQLYAAVVGLMIGCVWSILGLPLSAFALFLLPLLGFNVPRMWLRQRIKQRQHAITVALPDLLDMLAVCVSAGMGFDIALGLLADRGEGPLYEELEQLMRELRIGEPREQAFRHLVDRNSSDQLEHFVNALLQAEELGSPIAATLERMAEDMRVSRRYRAREQATKAGTKISVVLAIGVMPAVLCLMVTGMVLAILRDSGGVFGQ